MNILITGSSGFLGNHISLYLSKKNNVFTFDRQIQKRKEKKIKSFIYPKNVKDYVTFFKKKKLIWLSIVPAILLKIIKFQI